MRSKSNELKLSHGSWERRSKLEKAHSLRWTSKERRRLSRWLQRLVRRLAIITSLRQRETGLLPYRNLIATTRACAVLIALVMPVPKAVLPVAVAIPVLV